MFKSWKGDVAEMWSRLTKAGRIVIFPVWLLLSIVVMGVAGPLIVGPIILLEKLRDGWIKLFFKP